MPSLANVCTQNATLQATSQGAIINVLAQQRIISTGGCEEVGIGIGWGVGSPFIEKQIQLSKSLIGPFEHVRCVDVRLPTSCLAPKQFYAESLGFIFCFCFHHGKLP